MNVVLLFWIVAFVPFLPFTIQSGNSERHCPCNQTATNCTPCEQICNQPIPFCPAICRINNTCRCDDGFLRLAANSDRCVLKKDCPPPKPTCPRNQTATECTPCDQFCNQEPRICTKICIANSTCGCDTGYLRVDPNSDRCVLKKDCPAPKPTHQCPCNQTATNCAPCNPICNLGPRPCPLFCTVNATLCKCDEGYQQVDANTNRCVLKKDCPPPKPTCPLNQTATECTPCDQICNQEARVCTDICIKNSTCQCDSGYLRVDANSDRCILKEDCPGTNLCSPPGQRCGPGEKYTTCGSCDGTCSNPSPVCTLQCRVGCYCDQGNVRNDKGVCIPKWKCPKS